MTTNPRPSRKPPTPIAGAPDAPPISQQIRRVEAKGGVFVTQKDQTATGESGVFDMQANTVTLLGNVVISQGQNVVKGDRLTVDLTSGTSRVECGKSQGQCRVQALIQPGAMRGEKAGNEAAPASGPAREAPRQRSQPAGVVLNVRPGRAVESRGASDYHPYITVAVMVSRPSWSI